jgi:putative PIN family toxin of toxin-antitoxin system
MSPCVFIIDTNIVAAGLITAEAGSPTAEILDSMLSGTLFFFLSPELLREYRGVLLRPRLLRLHGLKEPEIDQILLEITANAVWREPPPDREHTSPDPRDAHLWSLLASEAEAVLITGDRLLIENPRPGGVVISPRAWVEHFRNRK